MRKPLLIFVSGAPGAGKSTLGREIAQRLRIPHMPRDEVLRGIELTKGDKIDRGRLGISVYYDILARMLEHDISLVTDGTIYKGISEKDITEHLGSRAMVVNIHVRAKDEYERFVERERLREGWSNEWVDSHKERLDEIYHQTVDPLDLNAPIIEVDATDGYDPPITEVVRRIREIYPDTRPGILSTEKKHKEEK